MGWFGKRKHATVNGSLGFRFDVPPSWQIVEDDKTSSSWRTPAGDAILIEHLAISVVATEETLDDLRDDLRRAAAKERGGIVECEIVAGFGAMGIEKKPAAGAHGVDYFGLALAPTSLGCTSILVVAREGGVTGMREAGVFAKLAADSLDDDWFADPYGAPLPQTGNDERWAFHCRSDAREFDVWFPEHPLTRTRSVLGLLRDAKVDAPSAKLTRRQRHSANGVSCELPAGFLAHPAAKLADGQVYVRQGFEARRDHVSLCRHPEFPDAGRSLEGAHKMIRQHIEWSRQRVLRQPEVETTTFEARRVIRAKWGAVLPTVHGEQLVHIDALYMPCGLDSLEISCMFDIDRAMHTDQVLREVVRSANIEAVV